VGIGPFAVGSAIERSIADAAEFGGARMMQTAGRIASSLASMLALWAAWKARGAEGALCVLPLLALPVAWVGDVARPRGQSASADSQAVKQRWLGMWTDLFIALLAALVAMRIDVHASMTVTMLGMAVVLALLADDGRWLGALVGAILPGGRNGLRTMRLVMLAMAAGPTQLAVTALALHTWLVSDRFALPLLAGVILIEVTAPARRNMATQLADVEVEIKDASDE
jgi:hypothetical protein